MRHRHDRFVKKLLRRTLEPEGIFTAEMDVSPDAQRFDGYFVPPPRSHRTPTRSARSAHHEGMRIVQQLKDEGRHEAKQNNLLTIYRTRFGSVPRKVRAAVERTRGDDALARWIEIFVARSAAEIAATVAGKKA